MHHKIEGEGRSAIRLTNVPISNVYWEAKNDKVGIVWHTFLSSRVMGSSIKWHRIDMYKGVGSQDARPAALA